VTFDTRALLVGLAQQWEAETNLDVAYAESYPTGFSGIGLLVAGTPSDAPKRQVAIASYDYPWDDPTLSDSMVAVQFKIRTPHYADYLEIDSELFDLLQGRDVGLLGGVTVVSVERNSGGYLGQGPDGRETGTQNYFLTVHRPTAHRY
jgi:hypothetical protein